MTCKKVKSKKIKYSIINDNGFTEDVIINKEKGSVKLKCSDGYLPEHVGLTAASIFDGDGIFVIDIDGNETIELDSFQLDYLRNILNIWYEEFEGGMK